MEYKKPFLVISVTRWSRVWIKMKPLKLYICSKLVYRWCCMCVVECWRLQVKSLPNSKKKHNKFIIEINIWDIEKPGTNICASMHVSTNSKKYVWIHYCECRSTRMATMEQQIIYRKYAWQDSQYVAQPSIMLYEVHKHIAVTINIKLTKIYTNVNLTKIQWNNNPYIGKTYDKIPNMKYNQQLDCIR